MKVIEIDVGPGGEQSETRTEGFTGGACLKAAAPFRAILGEVKAEEPTAEMQACGVGEQVGQR